MPRQIGSIDLKTTGYLYGQISSLESQVDGQIQTWAQSTNPAIWSSSDNEKHLGDLWLYTGTSDNTTIQTGFTFHPQGIYKYIKENSTYKWEAYSSTNNNIFDLTDSKKRVFYGTSTPTPPYDLRDLWVQGSNGDIKVCTTARTSGSGNTSDWALASKYIDSADATNIANNSADSRKTTESKTQYAVSSSNVSAPSINSDLWQDNMPQVSSLTSGNYLWTRECNKINGLWVYPTNPTGYLAYTFNGLSLFTNSVANDGYTSINGSTITTGRIQDSTGKNFIQLSAENNIPAGQVEFKDSSTWNNSTQGLQWDSTNGELNIKGNITANSLIIGSGNNSYNGIAAINISGYDIDIEIYNDSNEVDPDHYTYLIPHMYHNGENIDAEILDKTHYLWYREDIPQTDPPMYTAGAASDGGIRADRSGTYRVTYAFQDGSVGDSTTVQDRYIYPTEYITDISADSGILIHPKIGTSSSNYLQIDGNGVYIKNSSNINLASFTFTSAQIGRDTVQNILMDPNGVSIRNGSLPMVALDNDSLDFNVIDTVNNTYTNIATFGLNTRIGRNGIGYSNLWLSPESFTFISAESTNVFSTGVVSNEIATSAVVIDVDWDSSITTGLQLGSYTLAPNASTTVGGTFYSSVLANLDNGTRFNFNVEVYINGASFTSEIFSCSIYGTDGFTKGTSQTLTNSGYHGLNTALYYDGVGTLTLSGTITNWNQVVWNISRNEVVGGQTEPINTNIYNTNIGGNAFINLSNGGIYLGLSNKNAERTSDYNLYQSINALDWNSDVIVGITLAEHTKTIYNGGMLIDNIIDFTMVPLTASVTITSSDTAVISGGDVDYYDSDLYFIELDIVANGVTTITASITVGEQTYSDSCVVTVTS